MKTLFDTNPNLANKLTDLGRALLKRIPDPVNPVDAKEFFSNAAFSYEEQCEEMGLDPRSDMNRLSYALHLVGLLREPPDESTRSLIAGILSFYELWKAKAEPFAFNDDKYFFLIIGSMAQTVGMQYREKITELVLKDIIKELFE